MNVVRKNGDIVYNPQIAPKTGVIFLLCNWSGESILNLQHLLSRMENYPKLILYIVDIDEPAYEVLKEQYQVKSHGKGETFWVKDGKIISQILDYKTEGDHLMNYLESLAK